MPEIKREIEKGRGADERMVQRRWAIERRIRDVEQRNVIGCWKHSSKEKKNDMNDEIEGRRHYFYYFIVLG